MSPSALFFKEKNQTSWSVEDKEGGLIKVLTPNFNTFHFTPGCMHVENNSVFQKLVNVRSNPEMEKQDLQQGAGEISLEQF